MNLILYSHEQGQHKFYDKESGLEIINPDHISTIEKATNSSGIAGGYRYKSNLRWVISDTTFPLPSDLRFESCWHNPCVQAKDCLSPVDGWKCLGECKKMYSAIRLVKVESEESQYWLWDEVDDIFQANLPDQAMKICEDRFTIQRKKP